MNDFSPLVVKLASASAGIDLFTPPVIEQNLIRICKTCKRQFDKIENGAQFQSERCSRS
jgi:hypothetical protein